MSWFCLHHRFLALEVVVWSTTSLKRRCQENNHTLQCLYKIFVNLSPLSFSPKNPWSWTARFWKMMVEDNFPMRNVTFQRRTVKLRDGNPKQLKFTSSDRSSTSKCCWFFCNFCATHDAGRPSTMPWKLPLAPTTRPVAHTWGPGKHWRSYITHFRCHGICMSPCFFLYFSAVFSHE